MSKFEIIAKWIYSECDEPISEIQWLLESKYLTEEKLLDVYDDVIKQIEEL
jgi:hypothetical protein